MATTQLTTVLRYIRQCRPNDDVAGLPDGQLLARFADRRDEAAFRALVRRHGPMVFAVCRRVLHDGHAAEDAWQAVFLVLARRAASLGRPERLAGWLHGVAYRTALKARTAATRRHLRERSAAVPEAVAPPDRVVWSDLRPLLDEAIDRLPEAYRAPVVLCYLEGRSNAEAAEQLGCSRGTVASRLARARARLRGQLARHGLALSAGALATAWSQAAGPAVLPAGLVGKTAKAAALVAAGQPTGASLISPCVAQLMEGVEQAMCRSKLKVITAFLLGALLLAAGAGVLLQAAPSEPEQARPEGGRRPAAEKVNDPPAKAVTPQRGKSERSYRIQVVVREEKDGQQKILAEPVLTVKEGQAAHFRSGGDVTVESDGSVEFVPFGTAVTVVATRAKNGTVRMGLTLEHATAVQRTRSQVDRAARSTHAIRLIEFGAPATVTLNAAGRQVGNLSVTATVTGVWEAQVRSAAVPEVARPVAPLQEVAEQQAAHDFATAEFYRRTGHAVAAAFYYDLISRRYPASSFATEALKRRHDLKVPLPKAPAGSEEPPARVGQIIIVGNKKTPDGKLLEAIPLFPGAVLRYPDLRAAERQLEKLGLFRTFSVRVLEPESESAFRDILVTVEEK
jgi:RNA polymerase sigma factor (sigma-70 family)